MHHFIYFKKVWPPLHTGPAGRGHSASDSHAGPPAFKAWTWHFFFLLFSFFPPFFFLLPLFFYTRIKQYPHSKHIEKHREYIETTGETQKKNIGKIRLKGWFPIHRKHMVKKNTGARTKVWTRNALISPLPSATSCETVDLDLHHQVCKLCQWQTLTWKLGASIDETLGTNRISWNFLLNRQVKISEALRGFNIFWLMSSNSSN